MSSQVAAPPPGVVVSEYPAFQIEEYSDAAVLTLCVFEYLFDFRREVDFIWKRKITGAQALYLLNRYGFILNNVLNALYWLPGSAEMANIYYTQTCSHIAVSSSWMDQLQYLPWALFAALRTYALSRSWLLGIFIWLLYIVQFVVKTARFYLWHIRSAVDPVFGCGEIENANALQVDGISRGSLILAEVIIILVTWNATYRRGVFRENGLTIANVILLDGAIYFIAMLLLSVLDLIFSLLMIGPNTSIEFISLVSTFSEPLTSVLICRFLLDLQAVNSDNVNLDNDGAISVSDGQTRSLTETLNFARIVGTLGSSFQSTRHEEESSDEGGMDDAEKHFVAE